MGINYAVVHIAHCPTTIAEESLYYKFEEKREERRRERGIEGSQKSPNLVRVGFSCL